MKEQLIEALAKLDPANDDHWTADGLPRLDVVKDLLGSPVTRADITAAAEGFSRKNTSLASGSVEQDNGGDNDEGKETQQTPNSFEAPDPQVQQTPPATTEDDKEEEVGLGELDPKKVEEEMVNAREFLNKAQRRFKQAQEAMDVVISRREAAKARRTTAHDVKAYQKSQHEQRMRAAGRTSALAEAAAALEKK